MGRNVLPHVQAIILCDQIYRDDETGKCVLAGTFNRVFLDEYPAPYHPASLYMNLSDFSGTHEIQFRFVRLRDQHILDESPRFTIEHQDRREPHECIFDLPPLEFPAPGRYSIEILYDGDMVGHADIEALYPVRPGNAGSKRYGGEEQQG